MKTNKIRLAFEMSRVLLHKIRNELRIYSNGRLNIFLAPTLFGFSHCQLEFHVTFIFHIHANPIQKRVETRVWWTVSINIVVVGVNIITFRKPIIC